MKIALVRSTPGAQVIQRLGHQNKEFYRESDIEAVREALASRSHDVTVLVGDTELLPQLREIYRQCSNDGVEMFVYNLAYGVQGECRYTHIPSLLELAGLPYVGSGPRAHTIALDKHLAKLVMREAGLPTPAFQLIRRVGQRLEADLHYPVVVKPQFESTSFGIKLVEDDDGLDQAVDHIIRAWQQPALVEAFIDGLEVNCGVLGNDPAEALPVLEVSFGERTGGDAMLTYEAKRDRIAEHICPARIDESLSAAVQMLAVQCFEVIGCSDCARCDFRVDRDGNPQILEINSMVAVHEASSYFLAARTVGMSFADLVDRILASARSRYAAR